MTQDAEASGRLAGIGLGRDEERAYLAILSSPRRTRSQLAAFLQLDEARLGAQLDKLTELRLIRALPGAVPQYIANRPDAAFSALTYRKLAELAEVRVLTDKLAQQFEAAGKQSLLVETVFLDPQHPVSGIHAVFARMMSEAAKEVAGIDGAQDAAAAARVEVPAEAPVLDRGVRVRALYSLEQMLMPGRLANLRVLAAAGEDGRVSVRLPHLMFVFDRQVALLPPTSGDPMPNSSGVVVRDPTLVALMMWLFEHYWDTATPVPGPVTASPSGDLAARLATGMKDEEIAADLDLSIKTVRRRVTALLSELNVGTRFQAGVEAARRGWV